MNQSPIPNPAWKRGRWRRRLGLALISFGTLWSIAMAVSIKWWCGYCSPSWIVDVGDGTLYVKPLGETASRYSRPLLGWFGGVNNETRPNKTQRAWMWTWWIWGPQTDFRNPVHAYSIWPLAPLTLISGTILYWPSMQRSRRLRQNQCINCAYTRHGLTPEAPCPECGT